MRIVLLLWVFSLSSCAVMSPQECQTANWRDVGLVDGLAGKPLAMLNTRSGDCAEANVRIDTPAYLKGREHGLQTYCRIDNATRVGIRGESYHGVCPPMVDEEFRYRHRLGYDVYQLREEVARLGNRSESLERRLRSKEKDHEKHLDAASKDDERKRLRHEHDDERRRVRKELKELDDSLRRARDRLRDAEWALDRMH